MGKNNNNTIKNIPIKKIINKAYKTKYINGNIEYHNIKRQLHNENGPAVIENNGDEYWYQNNKLHRTDGPHIIYPNGDVLWYINRKINRYTNVYIIINQN